MKSFFLFLFSILLLLISWKSNAQIHVGSNEIPSFNNAGRLSQDDINELKKTTTLFILQDSDYNFREKFEDAIKKVWTITPFRIITKEEFFDYREGGNNSFFNFGGYVVERQNGSTGYSSTSPHFGYELTLPVKNRRGKYENNTYGKFMLSPDQVTNYSSEKLFMGKRSKQDFYEYFYSQSKFYNWQPGFLCGFLKQINDILLEGKMRGPYTETDGEPELTGLMHDTLYIPNYVTSKIKLFANAPTEPDDDEDISKYYPYPYKFIKATDLSDMILSGKKIYYLVYTRSSTDKFINIFSTDNFKMLYAQYVPISYNFRNKDLSKLARAIKHAK